MEQKEMTPTPEELARDLIALAKNTSSGPIRHAQEQHGKGQKAVVRREDGIQVAVFNLPQRPRQDEATANAQLYVHAHNHGPAIARELLAAREECEKLREVARMVDAWGNGLRHHTAHESKMVKAARAALQPKENGQ